MKGKKVFCDYFYELSLLFRQKLPYKLSRYATILKKIAQFVSIPNSSIESEILGYPGSIFRIDQIFVVKN